MTCFINKLFEVLNPIAEKPDELSSKNEDKLIPSRVLTHTRDPVMPIPSLIISS